MTTNFYLQSKYNSKSQLQNHDFFDNDIGYTRYTRISADLKFKLTLKLGQY